MITYAFATELLENRVNTSQALCLLADCGRGFYELNHIYDAAKKDMPEITPRLVRDVLLNVLIRGQGVKSPERDPLDQQSRALNAIYHVGVLQPELEIDATTEQVVYVFPTELHRRSVIDEDRWLPTSTNKLCQTL